MANSQPNKPKRRYDSSRRRAQARETRRRILEAARPLFIENGYVGATIEAIAQAAGVAPETIFATFGNKRTILAEVIGLAVGGDDRPVPLLQRAGPQSVLQEPDPARLLQLLAADITAILIRVAPLFPLLRTAARCEADIAELLSGMLAERLQNMNPVVQQLAARGPLRPGLSQEQAAEIIWGLTSPELFSLFTEDRGWSPAQYRAWLGDSLVRLLLP